MKPSFKRNLILGYSISLLLLIVSSVASYVSISNLLTNAKMVSHTNAVILNLESVLSTMKDAETGQRGFLLTGNETFLEPYIGSEEKIANTIDKLRTLVTSNSDQKKDLNELERVTNKRFAVLQQTIIAKRNGQEIDQSILLEGKALMDNARSLVTTMEDREQQLLIAHTDALNKFSAATPPLIIIAALLSLMITIFSFLKLNSDFDKRLGLQKALQQKDEETTKRIGIIQSIANTIAIGNYKTRIEDEGKDDLGELSVSLNQMATSLDNSFEQLSQKEWFQTGIAGLNDEMIGENDIPVLTGKVINFITTYTQSVAGAFYLLNDNGSLNLISGYALTKEKETTIQPGETLVGQAFVTKKIIEVNDVADNDYVVSFVAGNVKPKSVFVIPIPFNKKIKGVIEIAALKTYSDNEKRFLETASINIGIAVNTAQSRKRVHELLEETQAQSEELQSQHSELENINTELEAQAEKLQASEEELKVQQEELQQANQELEERSRLLEEKNELILERNLQIQAKAEELAISTKYKSEFLANMSHELRTPLNSILLLSRLLSENHNGNLSQDQIEYANVIQTSGNGLLTLIDEILDLSKIEAGKMELEYANVNIEVISNEIKSLFTPIANEKDISFLIEIKNNTPKIIETDRLRLEQILRNLISNALKFTKQGSVTLQIAQQNQTIAFAVKDTGIGIPKDKQQTIFEAFQQADGSTRRQFGGTGLGLSISRELAKLLGGEIQLQSEEGKGSEFTLLIPASKALAITKKEAEEEVIPIDNIINEVLSAPPANEQYLAQTIPSSIPDDRNNIQEHDKIILIIEDDVNFAGSLLNYTRQHGYKGIVAVRGDEGIKLAKQFLPMGILLDVQLPIKSGWQVMEELKDNTATKPIPVHMMSSYQVKNTSLLKGAVDFINKPVAFEKMGEMFQKIEEALNRQLKKVLIVEENPKHAKALAYFLEGYNVNAEVTNSMEDSIKALNNKEVNCVIVDMGAPDQRSYETLEEVKKTPGFENLPIIIFTGKNLSHAEEKRIKKYADSIVIKTAHSYQRILDEVSLFLHLVETNKKDNKSASQQKLGNLTEVLHNKTVLIADDDVRNIFSLTKSLENYGMNVISAIDGKDALKQLSENKKVDLVLMDMMMPEMDGYESTRRIREIPKYRNLPIIAVTAKAMTGDREKCITAGASDYITKPVDIDQLISLLRVWLYN